MVKKLRADQRRLYLDVCNVTLKAVVIPDQWRESLIVLIPKELGTGELGKQRPIKLMEVVLKGFMAVIKDRLKEVVEREQLLHPAQMGLRARRQTATSAMAIVGAVEDARRYSKELLHLISLDIKKAYDLVVRTLGKGLALRRLGVPLKLVEFLLEADRRSDNHVRTFWYHYLDEIVPGFTAERGFTQGASESPTLWVCFYDMVLEELEARGVGRDVRVDLGAACAGPALFGGFADDTYLMGRYMMC
jgi:hypothetical protein